MGLPGRNMQGTGAEGASVLLKPHFRCFTGEFCISRDEFRDILVKNVAAFCPFL